MLAAPEMNGQFTLQQYCLRLLANPRSQLHFWCAHSTVMFFLVTITIFTLSFFFFFFKMEAERLKVVSVSISPSSFSMLPLRGITELRLSKNSGELGKFCSFQKQPAHFATLPQLVACLLLLLLYFFIFFSGTVYFVYRSFSIFSLLPTWCHLGISAPWHSSVGFQ